MKPKPQKRHPSLIPLSHDHHHGLVLAERLVRGRATNPKSDWPEGAVEQGARLVHFFATDLQPHFEAEEAHLFPLAARALADGEARAGALIRDHETMRRMVREIESDPAGVTRDRLRAFGEILRAHIRSEERDFFPRVQAECAPDELEALAAPLSDAAAGAACSRR